MSPSNSPANFQPRSSSRNISKPKPSVKIPKNPGGENRRALARRFKSIQVNYFPGDVVAGKPTAYRAVSSRTAVLRLSSVHGTAQRGRFKKRFGIQKEGWRRRRSFDTGGVGATLWVSASTLSGSLRRWAPPPPQAKHSLTRIAANKDPFVVAFKKSYVVVRRLRFGTFLFLRLPSPPSTLASSFFPAILTAGRTARKLLGNFHEKCQGFTVRPQRTSPRVLV